MLVTSEGVPLAFTPAGAGSRAVATGIDVLLLGGTIVLVFLAIARSGGTLESAYILYVVLVFLALLVHPVVADVVFGRTVGKAVMGLRVIADDGGPVTLRQAALRTSIGLLEIIGTGGMVALATIVATRHDQRLGDLAANTLVIQERTGRHGRRRDRVDPLAVPAAWTGFAESMDVSRMTPAAQAELRSVLTRLPSLAPTATTTLVDAAVRRVAPLAHPGPPPGMAAADWLRCVGHAVREREFARARHRAARPRVGGTTTPPVPTPPGSGADSVLSSHRRRAWSPAAAATPEPSSPHDDATGRFEAPR